MNDDFLDFDDLLNSSEHPEAFGENGGGHAYYGSANRDLQNFAPVQRVQPEYDPEEDDTVPPGIYTEGPLAGLLIDENGFAWNIVGNEVEEIDVSIYPPEVQEVYQQMFKEQLEERAQLKENARKRKAHRRQQTFIAKKIEAYELMLQNPDLDEEERERIYDLLRGREIELNELNQKRPAPKMTRGEINSRKKLQRAKKREQLRGYLDPLKALTRNPERPAISPIRLTPDLATKLEGLTTREKVQVLNEYRAAEDVGLADLRPLPAKTNPAEKARDYYLLSTYFLKGVPLKDCSLLLNLSMKAVKKMMKRLTKEWLASSLVNMDELRAQELARISMVEAEAWLAWETSKQPKEHAKNFYEVRNGVKILRQGLEEIWSSSPGNSQYMRIILDCIKLRAEILNLHVGSSVPANQTLNITYVNDWRQSNVTVEGGDTPQLKHINEEALPAGIAQDFIENVDFEAIASGKD